MNRKVVLFAVALVFILSLAIPTLMTVAGTSVGLDGGTHVAKVFSMGPKSVVDDPTCPGNGGSGGGGC